MGIELIIAISIDNCSSAMSFSPMFPTFPCWQQVLPLLRIQPLIYYTKTAPMAGICTYKGYKSMLVNLSNIYTLLVLEHKSKRTC